jgi:NAD(P)-dependent dehydrogenase (short-subunit alcohol dehydrogenase family)
MPSTSDPAREEFKDKVVVVTGGSAGIGRGIAGAFAKSGARLVIAGRNVEAARRAVDEISHDFGGEAIAVQADMMRPQDCEALIAAAIAQLGAVDVLVNNAAHFALVPALEASAEDAGRFLDTNLLGPLFAAQAFARWTIANRRKGAIVNVSSISGARPAPGCALYSASKAALNSLTRSLALEWTALGVRVNAVAPGHVDTEGVRQDFAAGRLDFEAMVARIPAHRIADANDVAEAVMFLASERSRHIAGAILTIDGGESL